MKKKQKAKKKKTGGGGGAPHEEELDREEVRDELLALQAIFGDDLEVDPSSDAFTLHVVPHPGEAETNYVSLKLQIRCAPPRNPPHFPPTPHPPPPRSHRPYAPFLPPDTPGATPTKSYSCGYPTPPAWTALRSKL
jgi:hypothetical protein